MIPPSTMNITSIPIPNQNNVYPQTRFMKNHDQKAYITTNICFSAFIIPNYSSLFSSGSSPPSSRMISSPPFFPEVNRFIRSGTMSRILVIPS